MTDGSSPASAVLKDGNAVYTPGLSEHRSSASKFYHGDALGSTRGITDSTQAVTDSQLYDAFGNTVSRTGTTPSPFGFVGKAQYQSDSDSGLQLLGHRYYDPSIGRFLSSDPAKAGTNWYAYCSNNPLKGIDPQGLDEVIIIQDPGGFGNGGHTHIGVTDDTGNTIWYGFYPDEGRANSGGGSSSSSGDGPGFVKIGDVPRKDWKKKLRYVTIPIDSKDTLKIRKDVIRSGRKHSRYSIDRNNCATWGQGLLGPYTNTSGDPIIDAPPGSIRSPKELVDNAKGDVHEPE